MALARRTPQPPLQYPPEWREILTADPARLDPEVAGLSALIVQTFCVVVLAGFAFILLKPFFLLFHTSDYSNLATLAFVFFILFIAFLELWMLQRLFRMLRGRQRHSPNPTFVRVAVGLLGLFFVGLLAWEIILLVLQPDTGAPVPHGLDKIMDSLVEFFRQFL